MSLTFNKTTEKDYEEILKLYSGYQINTDKQENQKYLDKMQHTGFLVGNPLSYEKVQSAPFTITAKAEDNVAGFVRLDKMSKDLGNHGFALQWLGDGVVWDLFTNEQGYELGLILVDQDQKGKGVAKALLTQAEKFVEQDSPHLFSWTVSRPQNLPSIRFHQNNGFFKIAVYSTKEAWGIKNYESILFYKKLT